jgi:cephalosporin hydroxylase
MYIEDTLDVPLERVLGIIHTRTFSSIYFGVPVCKNPLDAWVYQEILTEIKPDVIIEIGNACGGTLLYLAHICDLLGRGRVIGIDIDHVNVPQFVKDHPCVTLITGDACLSFDKTNLLVASGETVLIIEDSSHTYENTLNVLRTFSSLVSKGSYFIVEDSICHHGIVVGPYPGPYEAIVEFLKENKEFKSDRNRESWFITFNPRGYLRRV